MIAPRKILAVKLRSLGDTVLMTAPLLELRRAYPHAEIDVVVSKRWAPLLENHPAVDRILTYERHKDMSSRAKALARLAITLRKNQYDWVLNFHASPSSATLAFATGAKMRSVHFHGHQDRNRHSTVIIPGKGTLKPIIERDMDTVRALGLSSPEGAMPQIFLKPEELSRSGLELRKLGFTQPLLAIGLGASRPTKSWPVEKFAAVALQWCRETQGSALCLVSQDEDALAQGFFRALDTLLLNFPGINERATLRSRMGCEVGLPLRELSARISQAALYLGNDSGPKHIAVSVGTPTVTLFGPEDPFEWHPYPKSSHQILYIENLSCRKNGPTDLTGNMKPWCGIEVCIEQNHRCMQDITEEQVYQVCRNLQNGNAK